MAGTRIGSKIEDLGASITVVTKEQMTDFAMLDINDIFSYEASTEGRETTLSSASIGTYPISDAQLSLKGQPRSRDFFRQCHSRQFRHQRLDPHRPAEHRWGRD